MSTPFRSLTASLALLMVMLPACSSTNPGNAGEGGTPVSNTIAPAWVDRPGLFDDGDKVILRAVGIAAHDPNPAARRSMAVARARSEISNMLEARVQSMVTDYFSTHRDFYDEATSSSDQFHESVIRIVSDQSLVGSRQVDAWRDPADSTEYVLMALEFDSVLSAFQGQIEATIAREQAQGRLRVKAQDALANLDEQIEKLRAMDAENLENLYPPAR